MKNIIILLTCFVTFSYGQKFVFDDPDSNSCVTPNGEDAKCVPVSKCSPIIEAIGTRNSTAYDFARKSLCKYVGKVVYVCCGSTGYFEVIIKEPTVTTPHPPVSDSILPKDCGTVGYIKRIVGGNKTALGEFPWMVLIGYQKFDGSFAGFNCGGTILNNQYVLTAAHCIAGVARQGFEPYKVRIGEWDITKDDDCSDAQLAGECINSVADIGIDQPIVHPYYNRGTDNNDIALLKLKHRFDFNNFVRPICLYNEPRETAVEYTVVGWGNLWFSGPSSPVLLKVVVPHVLKKDCQEILSKKEFTVTNNMLCAGGEIGKDSCQGDSGGPLMQQDEDKRWVQHGIVSKGIFCGGKYPAIYTRISRYYNWIIHNIERTTDN